MKPVKQNCLIFTGIQKYGIYPPKCSVFWTHQPGKRPEVTIKTGFYFGPSIAYLVYVFRTVSPLELKAAAQSLFTKTPTRRRYGQDQRSGFPRGSSC